MNRRDRLLLCGIIVVAVILRIGVAFYLGNVVDAPPLMTDQRSYHALGERLLDGHGFSFAVGWYPFTPANTPTAHWSFLYSLIVAAIYGVLGVQPLAVRLVQAVAGGVLLPLVVYKLGQRVFGADAEKAPVPALATAAPLAAAAAAAVYGYFVLYAATMMTETLFIVVVIWSLNAALGIAHALKAQQRPPLSLSLQLGISLSLGTLLRQSILPWAPVVLAYLLFLGWRGRQLPTVARTVVLVGAMLVASILPWSVRNYRAYGQFLLLNSNTGFAMYSAQHPMHGTRFSEFEAAPVPEELMGGNEAELDGQLMRIGIQFVLDEPGRYIRLSLSRVRAFFEFWPSPDTTLLHNIGRVGSFGLFLPLMLYGLHQVVRRPELLRRSELLILFYAFYTVLHVMTWAMVRYRLPVDAVAMPWVGLAIIDLGARVGASLRREGWSAARQGARGVPSIVDSADGKQSR